MIYKIITLYCFVVLASQSLLYAGTCSETIPQGQTETCDTITQYGITWTLAESESVGQFISGDYFVVHDGSVTILSVNPVNVDGVNGSMVNPTGGYTQGLALAQYNYDASLNVTFPLTVQPGQSIISTIGQSGAGTAWTGSIEDDSQLNSAAVLTILGTQPASGSFRPGYCGTTKKLYNISQIDTSSLKNLSTTNITKPVHSGFTTVGYYERGLERPWILIGRDWLGRPLHPILNMLDYHQHIGMFLSEAMLILHTDLRTETLLYRFIQTGIDHYAMAINGRGDSAFFGQVIALTAILLGDSDMRASFVNGVVVSVSRERQNFYRGVGWTGATALFQKDGNKFEEKALSSWVGNPDCKDETYRDSEDSQPQIGTSLAIMLAGWRAAAVLDYPVILDYADRFMNEPFASEYLPAVRNQCPGYTFGGYQSSGSSFVNGMWAAYRAGAIFTASSRRLSLSGRPIKLAEPGP